ncbi:MAG: 23S rRNA (cytidine(2498)-2'-O)-methyltransferase RlmM [Magnetococcus sp. DMHC-1]|nr:23S rRNA (cytidine(2498)-2'-O)-methyltransferase RlmM [Magnetococcales bacterium]
MDRLILYCRAGFEASCADEIMAMAGSSGIPGKVATGEGFVTFFPVGEKPVEVLARLNFRDMVFVRQWLVTGPALTGLPATDRVGPIMARVTALGVAVGKVWVETPDTNSGRVLSPLCQSLTRFLDKRLQAEGLLDPGASWQLHLFFLDTATVHVGLTPSTNGSVFHMGIPRLKMQREAPSRAALKLEEAMGHFLTPQDRQKRLRPGLLAVDLGAAPGGWSWYLLRQGLRVTAVDNANLAAGLLAGGQVRHVRTDAWRFVPPKPVAWMVCDIVDKPTRVAELVILWGRQRWCRETIFNLKLPMKKRFAALQHCQDMIHGALEQAGLAHDLRCKQLYHDREEITAHLHFHRE